MAKFKLIKENWLSRFLGTVIYKNKYLFFDYWSIVHFLTGCLMGLLFLFREELFFSSYAYVFSLLVIYEVIEVLLWDIAFKKERFNNIFWDITLGMIGFFIIIGLG